MIRVLIIDDESLARQRVRKLLEDRADVTIVQECRNGKEAIDAISNEQPDLIFLDIQMKDMTGFDVLRALPQEKWPLTIFVTAYDVDRDSLEDIEVTRKVEDRSGLRPSFIDLKNLSFPLYFSVDFFDFFSVSEN